MAVRSWAFFGRPAWSTLTKFQVFLLLMMTASPTVDAGRARTKLPEEPTVRFLRDNSGKLDHVFPRFKSEDKPPPRCPEGPLLFVGGLLPQV
jgi:hypothetical protein